MKGREYLETAEILGVKMEKYDRAGEGFLYEISTSGGPEVTRNKVEEKLGVKMGPGTGARYQGEIEYEEGRNPEVKVLSKGKVHIISRDKELEELLEPQSDNLFG